MTKIVLRADGGYQSGLGHIYRLIAIAEMIYQNYDCYFVTTNLNPSISNTINTYCKKIIPCIEGNDVSIIIEHFSPKTTIIILDGYSFNTAYQNSLKKENFKLISIDDTFEYKFVSDVVINHCGGIAPNQYSLSDNTELHLGLKYSILRSSFLKEARNKPTFHKSKTDILICLGGSDQFNLSNIALKKSIEQSQFKNIHIILGASYKHREELNRTISTTTKNVFVYQNISAEKIIQIMKKCYTAILSPSTICFEFIATRGIIFLMKYVKNQDHIYQHLIKSEMALDISDFGQSISFNESKILQNQIKSLDGKSDERINLIIKKLAI